MLSIYQNHTVKLSGYIGETHDGKYEGVNIKLKSNGIISIDGRDMFIIDDKSKRFSILVYWYGTSLSIRYKKLKNLRRIYI